MFFAIAGAPGISFVLVEDQLRINHLQYCAQELLLPKVLYKWTEPSVLSRLWCPECSVNNYLCKRPIFEHFVLSGVCSVEGAVICQIVVDKIRCM